MAKVECREMGLRANEVESEVTNSDSFEQDQPALEPRDLTHRLKKQRQQWLTGGIDIDSTSTTASGHLKNRLSVYLSVTRDSVSGTKSRSSNSELFKIL